MDNEQVYIVQSSPLVNAPGMFRFTMSSRMPLDDEGQTKAARLFMLSAALPDIPAGVLFDLVDGAWTWGVEGTTVRIRRRSDP